MKKKKKFIFEMHSNNAISLQLLASSLFVLSLNFINQIY